MEENEEKVKPKPKLILPKPISIEEIPVMPVLKPPVLKIDKENREENREESESENREES